MTPNIKDIKPWEPKDPKRDNEANCEWVTLSSLLEKHDKDQLVAETTIASSNGTKMPLHDEGM
jgi:hypothetical protein